MQEPWQICSIGQLGQSSLLLQCVAVFSLTAAKSDTWPMWWGWPLGAVLAALEEVTSAIEVAEVLPLTKRIRAHQKVDRVLDDLEAGLFNAALPQLPH